MSRNPLSAGTLLGRRFVIVEPLRSEERGVCFSVYDMMQLKHAEVVVPWNERGNLDPDRFALRVPTSGPPASKLPPWKPAAAASRSMHSWDSGPAAKRPARPSPRTELPPAKAILPPVRVLAPPSLQRSTRSVILTPARGHSTNKAILPPVLGHGTQRAVLPSPLSTIRLSESDLHELGMLEPTDAPAPAPAPTPAPPPAPTPAPTSAATPPPMQTSPPNPLTASLPRWELADIERGFKQLLGRRTRLIAGALLACGALVLVGWLLGRGDVEPPRDAGTTPSTPALAREVPPPPAPSRAARPAQARVQQRAVLPTRVAPQQERPHPAKVDRQVTKRPRRARRAHRRRAVNADAILASAYRQRRPVDADAILASAVAARRSRRGRRAFVGTVDPFSE